MCLHVYIHNTSHEHETRFPSVVNRYTGYSVYTPFQDPYTDLPSCEYPHIFEQVSPHEVCPWHSKCCRLEQRVVCQTDATICGRRVKYHHFCFDDEDVKKGLSFLDAYLRNNASLLPLVSSFFRAGVEIRILDTYKNNIDQSLAANANQPILAAQFARISELFHYAIQRFDYFANIYDSHTRFGALPYRPGVFGGPAQNLQHSNSLGLREVGPSAETDDYKRAVLCQCARLPEFHIANGNLPFGNDPSVVLGFSFSIPIHSFPQPKLCTPSHSGQKFGVDNGITQSSTPSSSSPLRTYSADISTLEDSESDEDSEEESEDEDEGADKLFPIESLVDHRPHGVPRSRVTAYKIRWEGEWPRNQKQTWQDAKHTPPNFIDEYWKAKN